MSDETALALFQSKLLALLDSEQSVKEIHDALQNDAELEKFREYIEQFEPRMIEVAAELVKKMGTQDLLLYIGPRTLFIPELILLSQIVNLAQAFYIPPRRLVTE